MKKQAPARIRKIPVIFGALVVIWLLGLTFFVSLTREQVASGFDAGGKSSLDQYRLITKLGFCIDNDIKPCDDIAIREWNAAHPEEDRLRFAGE